MRKRGITAVWGCERHWIYLIGRKFKLITDNRAVKLIFNNTVAKPPARIERWALRLTQFDYEVEHRPSEANVADYFSRHPVRTPIAQESAGELKTENYINLIVQNSLPFNISLSEVIEATKRDHILQSLAKWLSEPSRRALPTELKTFEHSLNKISVTQNGLLLHDFRIILPLELRERAIKLAHRPHMGITKNKAFNSNKLWFPNMSSLVEEEVKGCHACQTNDLRQHFEPLRPTRMPDVAWQNLSIERFG